MVRFSETQAGVPGIEHYPGRLDGAAQERLIDEIARIIVASPLLTPTMPRSGKPFSVKMTNCGTLGWVSDRAGYRYEKLHPVTGKPWPEIPDPLLALWREVAPDAAMPEACLVNYYRPGTRLGLHRDEDEEDFTAPVVSVSLGDDCVFRIGGLGRRDPVRSIRLASGDVIVLAGRSRLAYHGVAKIEAGTSALLARHAALFAEGGRINLTLRRVSAPAGRPRVTIP